jgi:hypothetical protein
MVTAQKKEKKKRDGFLVRIGTAADNQKKRAGAGDNL